MFNSSIRKELSQSFVTTLVVLLTVVMSNMLIQTLGQASRGSLNPSDVILVMGLTALGYSATLLTLSLFLAVISTLSRMYRDSEMVIWYTSGQSLPSFIKPVLRFGWPILLGIFFSALVIWPWSNQKIQDLKQKFESRGDIERVAPGKFVEFAGGTGVFFIDDDASNPGVNADVFVSRVDGDWDTVTSAKQGYVEVIKGERFLDLKNGQQVAVNNKSHEARITTFKNYQVLIKDDAAQDVSVQPPYAVSSFDLVNHSSSVRMGELSWRLGQGLCAINLLLLAIGLSTVNPRAAKSYHFAKAILVFIIYYNLINFTQRWIADSKISIGPMLLILHGAALVLALALIKSQQSQFTFRKWLSDMGLFRKT